MITQVRVDPFDAAFSQPSKVIGRYMTEEEAKAEEKKNNHVIKDGDKGYRRIIGAPRPMEIYELDAIKALLDADQIVIACGGGGIPVLQQGTRLKGASAVIEKDLTSACLAEGVQADMLLLLTGVEKVMLNFDTPQATPLDHLSVEEQPGISMKDSSLQEQCFQRSRLLFPSHPPLLPTSLLSLT